MEECLYLLKSSADELDRQLNQAEQDIPKQSIESGQLRRSTRSLGSSDQARSVILESRKDMAKIHEGCAKMSQNVATYRKATSKMNGGKATERK